MTSAQVQAASDTDHLLRLAIRVGSIGIFQSDLERQQTSFSPELCTTLGLPVGTTMPYDKAMQLFDQRDRGAVLDKAEAAANQPTGENGAQCAGSRAPMVRSAGCLFMGSESIVARNQCVPLVWSSTSPTSGKLKPHSERVSAGFGSRWRRHRWEPSRPTSLPATHLLMPRRLVSSDCQRRRASFRPTNCASASRLRT